MQEGQTFDCKSILIEPKHLATIIVAMANADGGMIAVGISDKTRRIEGVNQDKEHLNDILRTPLDFCVPSVSVTTDYVPCTDAEGRDNRVLLMHIPASPRLHANQADEVFWRVGDKSRKLTFDERLQLMYDKGERYYEDSTAYDATLDDIDMDAVKILGEMIKDTAELTKEADSIGCAKLVVFCNAPDDNPFMAGAFHGVTEGDCVINVGVSGPGVVKKALEKVRGENFEELCETIKKTAFKVTRVGQLVAKEASKMLGVPFGIVDLSLAPTPAVGDSVGEILEEIGLEYAGAPGTTAALALLNDQVKKGGVMASSYVGGLSGAFIPVSEDQRMIDAVSAGALTLEKLEAMTCVCSVGLDMIAIPGDTSPATISGIIADEMALGMINQKTTAVRLIPVIGKGVGDQAEFGGLLGYAPIMPVNRFACDKFVNRGGRIPAPIHSFKN